MNIIGVPKEHRTVGMAISKIWPSSKLNGPKINLSLGNDWIKITYKWDFEEISDFICDILYNKDQIIYCLGGLDNILIKNYKIPVDLMSDSDKQL